MMTRVWGWVLVLSPVLDWVLVFMVTSVWGVRVCHILCSVLPKSSCGAGHLQLYTEFEATLGYMRLCPKQNRIKQKQRGSGEKGAEKWSRKGCTPRQTGLQQAWWPSLGSSRTHTPWETPRRLGTETFFKLSGSAKVLVCIPGLSLP